MIKPRKKRNSSKINLTISLAFHGLLIGVAVFLAAKGGLIPAKYIPISILRPEEKKPEPPKPKPDQPKPEQAKAPEAPKSAPPPPVQTASAPPPDNSVPAVAPAAAVLSGMEFSDGARTVDTISNPVELYKAQITAALRNNWNRPEDMADDTFVAQANLTIDVHGRVTDTRWISGSGNPTWDEAVKTALSETKTIGQPPPKGFPDHFTVRFDVEMSAAHTLQLSSR